MDANEIASAARDHQVRLVRFLWCGNDGTVRAKATTLHGLEQRMQSGIGVTLAMEAMNSLDELQPVEGMGPVGELRIVPDPDTFRVLPYAPHAAAMLTDQLALDGGPAPVCQRSFLKRMEAALAVRDAVLYAGFENEFTLAKVVDGDWRPLDKSLCFSTIGMTASQEYADELVGSLDRQGVPVEQYYAELGPGQQEITTGYAPALHAADDQILTRETIRGVATARGLAASLAPKPWPDAPGNGCHIHFSLWDRDAGRNRFYSPDAALSREAAAFSAGVLDHLPALCGLTAPSYNSYRRISPQTWSGAYTCWGYDNREAPLRVPSVFRGLEEASTNVELKTADASCNPYLALGGLIAAGLDGIDRELELPEPVDVDPETMTEEERAGRGIGRLPETQADALDALAADSVLSAALGETLLRSYLAVRRSEWQTYSAEDEEFERRGHFLKY
ncbi:MAG: glutamine synthetase [Actinobacteria bacterium]|nr:glutamine synthetase [Actinomycetota bacterium]